MVADIGLLLDETRIASLSKSRVFYAGWRVLFNEIPIVDYYYPARQRWYSNSSLVEGVT